MCGVRQYAGKEMKRWALAAGLIMLAVGILLGVLLPSRCTKGNAEPQQPNTVDEWVDLGLPSGLLWAKCNLEASKPEQCGDYYAWGETQPKNDYSWGNYRYGRSGGKLTKYCSKSDYGEFGFTDNMTTLKADDDASTLVLGSGARIPTRAEWNELINNTTSEWMTVSGKKVRRFTSKKNGNRLLLPAAGYYDGTDLYKEGRFGYYWSSSLYEGSPNYAWRIYVSSDIQYVYSGNRYYGLSVRAVRSAGKK